MRNLMMGNLSMNVSMVTEMSSGEVKSKLHPETLIGATVSIIGADGKEYILEVSEVMSLELKNYDSITYLPVESEYEI